jgi:hypothetical protein
MPTESKSTFGSSTPITITLASLASSTAGVGRQCTLIDNSTTGFQRVHVYYDITTGTTPTANKSLYFFLLKRDNHSSPTITTDNAGNDDAALTVSAADLIYGVITSSTSNTHYRGSFTIESPGPSWGLAVVQDTGAALHATASNHALYFLGENPQAQT